MNDPASITYAAALEENRRLDALGRDITDAESFDCDRLTMIAYASPPQSVGGIADALDTLLEIEGDLIDPSHLVMLNSIRSGARALQKAQSAV